MGSFLWYLKWGQRNAQGSKWQWKLLRKLEKLSWQVFYICGFLFSPFRLQPPCRRHWLGPRPHSFVLYLEHLRNHRNDTLLKGAPVAWSMMDRALRTPVGGVGVVTFTAVARLASPRPCDYHTQQGTLDIEWRFIRTTVLDSFFRARTATRR